MTRKLFLFGALCCLGGAASAQSKVTLYGSMDLNLRYVKAQGQHRLVSETAGDLNSTLWGLRGVEDLGGGMRAGFNLQGDILADTGASNATKFFNRISTLNLEGPWGELRLGRDYTPTFQVLSLVDPMNYISLGSGLNVRQLYNGSRMDNGVQYLTPAGLGGFFAHLMVTAAESGTELDRPTRYVGGRFGWARGPFSIVVCASEGRFAIPFAVGFNTVTTNTTIVTTKPGDKQRNYSANGSWDTGPVRLAVAFDRENLDGYHETVGSLYATVPIGLAEIRGGYDRSRLERANGLGSTVDQYKATAYYNLSKRTAVYVTVSRLANRDATRLTLPGAAGQVTAGGHSQGADIGIRHFF